MRLLCLFSLLIQSVYSLNILLFLIGTNQFERGIFEFLAQQLALRHHNVVTVKPILIPEEPRLVKPKLHLVKEKTLKNLLPRELYQPLEKAGSEIPWSENYEVEKYQHVYWTAHNASCYKMLNSNILDTLKKEELDVAIVYSGNPCQQALTHVLGVPTIYFDLEGLSDETLVAAGAPLAAEYPTSNCEIFPESQFATLEQIRHSLCYLREMIVQSSLPVLPSLLSNRYRSIDKHISNMFAEDYTLKKRFKNFPDVNELKKRSELFFANTDILLEYPRSLPPTVIPVGGLHLDIPKPLFYPWNTTIASAEEGMILVSMGTQADSSGMTEKQAKTFLGALSKLNKYRIYWRVGPNMKLPGIKEEDVPSHINLTAYFPQNDLLAHTACKLFVTNGGMASVMEAVAHGVPIVGIPLYGSNRHNLNKVAAKGLGVVLQKQQLSATSLYNAMKSVLDGTKYKTTAKDMSKEFTSRGTTAFARALHYIEHVGRHHSAAFLQPTRTNLFQKLQLHLFLLILLILYLPLFVLKRLLRLCFGGRPTVQEPSKKHRENTTKAKKDN